MAGGGYRYSEETKRLIGYAFDIFNQIGPRHPEKVYQRAFENKLISGDVNYRKELYCKIEVDGKRVGSYYLDFLIDNKIIVELKVRNEIYQQDIAQVLTYMNTHHIGLGLLIMFSRGGVKIKRLIL
jgi:GxxExxY protein